MSRHGTILDVTRPPELAARLEVLTGYWHEGLYAGAPHPRSLWLSHVELEIGHYLPAASSRDRNVTARSLAPFPLRDPPLT